MYKKIICSITLFLTIVYPINVGAQSITVMDINSGRVLYSKNQNKKSLIASITKIMTAIVVLENSTNLDKKITVGEEVLKMYGTNIYIEVGEKLTIRELLYGLLLRSGNDAAETLSINILGKKKFVEKMNDTAKKIGMKNTTFLNVHGLDDDTKNYSTSYDMSLLSKYAYKNKTYRKIISTKKYEVSTGKKTYLWYNRNKLLTTYKYCNGGKNGYTPSAGKTLVTTASNNNMNITITTLDDARQYETHKNYYDKVFKEYKNYKIIDKETFEVNKTFTRKSVYIKKSFIYPLKENELEQVSTKIFINKETQSNIIGNVVIKINNKKIGELKIYEKKQIKKESILTKIKTFFSSIF